MNTAPLLVTIEEAAAQLAVSTRTVRRLIESGKLPRRKIMGAVRIPYAALVAIAQEPAPCLTEETTQTSGGSATRRQKVAEFESLLGRRHSRRQKPSKPSAA